MIPPRKFWHLFPARIRDRWTMASFRENMAWFGHPMDHLTDDEILEGAARVARMVSSLGVTTEQAATAMTSLQAALQKAENTDGGFPNETAG